MSLMPGVGPTEMEGLFVGGSLPAAFVAGSVALYAPAASWSCSPRSRRDRCGITAGGWSHWRLISPPEGPRRRGCSASLEMAIGLQCPPTHRGCPATASPSSARMGRSPGSITTPRGLYRPALWSPISIRPETHDSHGAVGLLAAWRVPRRVGRCLGRFAGRSFPAFGTSGGVEVAHTVRIVLDLKPICHGLWRLC